MATRQGCYSQDGDIVVLCAYLGQLARVRDALAKEVVVVIDDVDQEALEDQEDEAEGQALLSGVEHVKVGKRVKRYLITIMVIALNAEDRFACVPLIIIKARRPRSA